MDPFFTTLIGPLTACVCTLRAAIQHHIAVMPSQATASLVRTSLHLGFTSAVATAAYMQLLGVHHWLLIPSSISAASSAVAAMSHPAQAGTGSMQ